MKRITIFLLCLVLTGCKKSEDAMNIGLQLRSDLLNGNECCFFGTVTADYGDETYTFAMDCQLDSHGNLSFTVNKPTTIAGITGGISAEGGALTFDDAVLTFPLLADNQLSPVSAPWVVMKSLRGGYITSAGWVDEGVRLVIDDSYEADAWCVHVWLNADNTPRLAEIYHNDRRILTIEIENFRIL